MQSNAAVGLPNQTQIIYHPRRGSASSASTASSHTSTNTSRSSYRSIDKDCKVPGKDPGQELGKSPAAPRVPVVIEKPAPQQGQQGTQQGQFCAPNADDSLQFGDDNVTINDIDLSQQLARAMEPALESGFLASRKSHRQLKKVAKHLIAQPTCTDLEGFLNCVRVNHTGPADMQGKAHVLGAAAAVKAATVQQRAGKAVSLSSGRVLERWARAVVSASRPGSIDSRQRVNALQLIAVTQKFVNEGLSDGHLSKAHVARLETASERLTRHRAELA